MRAVGCYSRARVGKRKHNANRTRTLKPPWPNGQGVGLLIRRLRVRVPQGVHLARTVCAQTYSVDALCLHAECVHCMRESRRAQQAHLHCVAMASARGKH